MCALRNQLTPFLGLSRLRHYYTYTRRVRAHRYGHLHLTSTLSKRGNARDKVYIEIFTAVLGFFCYDVAFRRRFLRYLVEDCNGNRMNGFYQFINYFTFYK